MLCTFQVGRVSWIAQVEARGYFVMSSNVMIGVNSKPAGGIEIAPEKKCKTCCNDASVIPAIKLKEMIG